MSATKKRSLKVRCATWEQVEAFYSTKLKDRNKLAIRVPFNPEKGSMVTLALGLPNELVMAIDGIVRKVAPAPDGKRAQILLELVGFTDEVLGRLEALVADSRANAPIAKSVAKPTAEPPPRRKRPTEPPPAVPTDAPVDEVVEQPALPTVADVQTEQRDVFLNLESEHRRLREAAAHDVLGVGWDAGVDDIRRAYFSLTKRYHPDTYAKYRSEAVMHLSQEVFIHINKAYDRMRDAMAAAGQGMIAGPALLPQTGWVAGFEDVEDAAAVEPPPRRVPPPRAAPARSASYINVPNAEPVAEDALTLSTDDQEVVVSFGEGPKPAPEAPPAPASAPDPAPAPARTKRVTESVPLTEDSLFGDFAGEEEPATKEASQVSQLFATGSIGRNERDQVATMETEARAALESGDYSEARELLAQALHIDARNRQLRALYHVANGHCLSAQSKRIDAMTQFETALRHDPDCEPARDALAAKVDDTKDKKRSGLFKRFFRE